MLHPDFNKCYLCHHAPCSQICPNLDPERLIRAVRFDNVSAAIEIIRSAGTNLCAECSAPCETSCVADVPIRGLIQKISQKAKEAHAFSASSNTSKEAPDLDLSGDICGVNLEHPFLLSSSVVASNYEMIAKAFDLGWAGACYKTICKMDMHETSPRFSATRSPEGSFSGFKNIEQLSDHTLEENMEIIRRLKKDYPTKVIIASIMGRNEDEWESITRSVSEAGADVIELNFSCPNMEEKGVGVDIGLDPSLCRRFSAAARRGTNKPILAKMTPNIADMRIPARASLEGGADGIAAINTVKSITNIDLESFSSNPDVIGKSAIGGYSGHAVKPIALRFLAEMKQDPAIAAAHISGMGGIYTWKDAAEYIALGAESLQITTAVMEYGYRIIEDLLSGLKHYMASHGYEKLSDFTGAALSHIVDANELERDTILFPAFDLSTCAHCGRCYISCYDGGHQAITFDPETRIPKLNGSKCVGCHLCLLVCPTKSIGTTKKRIQKR